MENILIPLISPLSRKYYEYASDQTERKHHRAEDVRICLEYVCDQIVFIFVSDSEKQKWNNYDLHDKLNASKSFIDKQAVNKVIKAKIIGNKGVHQGEEGKYSSDDIDQCIEDIRKYSLEIFYSFFKTNGFDGENSSWVPTVFSTLPPIYRVEILEKYYTNCCQSLFVIDKLAKAYLKNGQADKAREFLWKCFAKKELTDEQFQIFDNDISLLERNFSKLPIAKNLEIAKKNFNSVLVVIPENERDSFICLMSMILNGNAEQMNK